MSTTYDEWAKARKELIAKIKPFIKNGHLPHRGAKSQYPISLESVYRNWNCFGHACFNFTNTELFALDVNYVESIVLGGRFAWASVDTTDGAECELEDFLGETGLEFRECEPEATLKNNQWKVALYFSPDWDKTGAYHFLKQEKDGLWSAKDGFTPCTSLFDALGEKVVSNGDIYEFHKTFAITNPNVKEK